MLPSFVRKGVFFVGATLPISPPAQEITQRKISLSKKRGRTIRTIRPIGITGVESPLGSMRKSPRESARRPAGTAL